MDVFLLETTIKAFGWNFEIVVFNCFLHRFFLFSYTPYVPKWLSYFPDFVVPKWLSGLSAWLEIWGSESNISVPNFTYQEVFWHRNFWGHFGVVVVVYFKSHTYNYSVNGQRALISPKLETHTIIWGWR